MSLIIPFVLSPATEDILPSDKGIDFDKCYEVSNEGDIILLSPASASWDQYKECEVRGAEFKKKVEDLKNGNIEK